jgi:hypothetical protein
LVESRSAAAREDVKWMPRQTKVIVNLTKWNVVCERAVLADTPLPRMRGLLGMGSLRRGSAVLLQPAPSIHTAFVRFAFDAVFLDRNLRVVRVIERVKPWRIVSDRRAASVLQLAAGEIVARGIEVGDQVVVSDEAEMLLGGRGPSAEQLAPWRILVASQDRRFRSVAAALLARRDYDVAIRERTDDLSEGARRAAADVIVVDASEQPEAVAHEQSLLETLSPDVALIVVSDAAAVAGKGSTAATINKWGEFDRLFEAIEEARAARVPAAGAS